MKDLIERLRLLEIDHAPDGWPAIRMCDVSALLDALEQMAAALAVAKKDAARYRWLRDSHYNRDALLALLEGVPVVINGHNEFDAAIDAAMKEQQS